MTGVIKEIKKTSVALLLVATENEIKTAFEDVKYTISSTFLTLLYILTYGLLFLVERTPSTFTNNF